MKVATLNARSLMSEDSFLELKNELQNVKWGVVGLSEVRKRGESLETLNSGHMFCYMGSKHMSVGGVGIIIHKKLSQNVVLVKAISERVIYINIQLNKRCIVKFIQVYAPTSNTNINQQPDEKVEQFYEDMHKAIRENNAHYTIIGGDFNAKMGTQLDGSEISLEYFGSPGRNDRGEIIIPNDVGELNKQIVDTLKLAQARFCPKTKRDQKITFEIVEEFYTTFYTHQINNKVNEDGRQKIQNHGSEHIPEITQDEIQYALKKMKNKAPGDDGIVTEAIKIGGTSIPFPENLHSAEY
ncbi:uncharacterized protein [Diabrotica undecimpunctata]|uniref:uncharacterized protein n=1 Tax=Diabrotica undecimpunctata TaxID=50387 RepID=UPI003B63AE3A